MPRDRSRSPSRRDDKDRRKDKEREWDRDRDRDRDRGSRRDRQRDERKDKGKERERSDRRDRDNRRDRDGEDRRDRDRDRDDHPERDRDDRRDRDRRDRGRDDRRDDRRRRDPSPSESEEELLDLTELGVEPISFDDYFLRANEFRYWLKAERSQYLDQLSSEVAHKYFRRFVRRWNDGALPRDCYAAHESTAARASENTAYKWMFAEHRSRVNSQELAAARADVDRMTHPKRLSSSNLLTAPPRRRADADSDDDIGPRPELPPPRSRSPTPGPTLGPTLPTVSERQLSRETAVEVARLDRMAERRSGRKEALERAEEVVPRQAGREGKMADRRAANEENKKMRDKDVAGLEVDEGTLMGDGSSFAAAVRARDAAQAKWAAKKADTLGDQRSAIEERMAERRGKEAATMDMLKSMARDRFG